MRQEMPENASISATSQVYLLQIGKRNTRCMSCSFACYEGNEASISNSGGLVPCTHISSQTSLLRLTAISRSKTLGYITEQSVRGSRSSSSMAGPILTTTISYPTWIACPILSASSTTISEDAESRREYAST